MKTPLRKDSRIDLGLEVIEALRPAGVKLSHAAIAAVCGCSWQAIQQIEQRALKKMREKGRRP